MLCHGKHKWYCCHTTSSAESFRSNSRGHHNDLGIIFLEFEPEALQQLWTKNCQPTLFSGLLELQPKVLADQGWRSKKSCQRTAPRHLFDLHKKATAQVLLLAHASLEVLPNPQCPPVSLACRCLKNSRTGTDNCHGALDSDDFHLQPFHQISVLAGFCSDLLASKTHGSPARRSGGTNFIRSARSRRDVFSLLYFKMSLHSQFFDLFIEEVLLGWRGCQLLWIHGSWVQEISWRLMASTGQIPWAALRINWAGVICARVV